MRSSADRVLAIIPARGGSKGLPRKNVLPLAGRPLISWTIAAARAARLVDRVVVSSDDPEILAVAGAEGPELPLARPPELAADDTPVVDVVLHVLDVLGGGFEYVVLLQPTSPLRSAEDIDGCLDICARTGAPSCVSVTEPDKSPYWMYTEAPDGRLAPLLPAPLRTRRQDLPAVYALNGAVYAVRTAALIADRAFVTADTRAWKMPRARSVDIDTELDLRVAELLATTARPSA